MEHRVSQLTSSQFQERFCRTVVKINTSESLANQENYRNPKMEVSSTYFVVKVKPAEISSFGCSSVSMSESTLLYQDINSYSDILSMSF